MRVGVVLGTVTHLALAVTTTAWVAMVVMVVFGAHAFIWSTTSRTVRVRAVPLGLQGRVGGLYAMGLFGGILLGQLAGGLLARAWGFTGPFWFGFAGSAVILTPHLAPARPHRPRRERGGGAGRARLIEVVPFRHGRHA